MFYARWNEVVIQNGLNRRETFQPHQFFAIQLAVLFSKLCMSFVRDLSEFMVERHVFSCSLYSERWTVLPSQKNRVHNSIANVFGPFAFDCLRAVCAFSSSNSRVREAPPGC